MSLHHHDIFENDFTYKSETLYICSKYNTYNYKINGKYQAGKL